ncbi:uncharacterized protein K452DRAFT_138884 [Aplosporella prunicola CBS 121167]|uniref:Uncharacterized protein n=1 Tax=Aplosporella prunicola CBS 121167 TaxID=1176127 RepID=A0A6A6AW72_9PEZI|nr:uncharacterized protein K452DRAFT_138884 [Aplosporella prunicola CBS 121167]KAF2136252.1 hypothetical protein K452DRAFT_138884 [Aplosporella prunicola CBS 121167]
MNSTRCIYFKSSVIDRPSSEARASSQGFTESADKEMALPFYNPAIEKIREEEYPALKGKTYLDHGGATSTTTITNYLTNSSTPNLSLKPSPKT